MSQATSISVLRICGSLRARSFNRALLAQADRCAPEGMSLLDAPTLDMPLFNGDVLAVSGFPSEAVALAQAIRSADGLLIASPEYNHSVAAPLKNAIDWLSVMPEQPFAGKPIAIQSAATGILGGSRGQYHLRQVLNSVEATTMSKPEVFITLAASRFDGDMALNDEPALKMVIAQLAAFAAFIRNSVGGA